ncbi:hypothetical protein IFR05_013171 [Cadophora sp. M221]|nr:hypothetical protein IFR05_013171 [Cadophora sp. M221]
MPKVRQEDVPAEYDALNRRPPNRAYLKCVGELSSLDPAVAATATKKFSAADEQALRNLFGLIMELPHRYEVGEKMPHMGLLTPFMTNVPEIRPHLAAFFADLPPNLDAAYLVMVDGDLLNLKRTTLITFNGRERQMWKPPILLQDFRAFMRWKVIHMRNVKWELSDIPDSLLDEEVPYDERVAIPLLNGSMNPPSRWPINSKNFMPSPGALNQTGPPKVQNYPGVPSAKSMVSILRSTSTQSTIGGENGVITGLQGQTNNLIDSSNERRPQDSMMSPGIGKKQRGWDQAGGLDSNLPKQPSGVQNKQQAAQLGDLPAEPTRGVSNLSSIRSHVSPFRPAGLTSNNSNNPMQTTSIHGHRNPSAEFQSTDNAGQHANPQYSGPMAGSGQSYVGYVGGVSDGHMNNNSSMQQSLLGNQYQNPLDVSNVPPPQSHSLPPQVDFGQYDNSQELQILYQQHRSMNVALQKWALRQMAQKRMAQQQMAQQQVPMQFMPYQQNQVYGPSPTPTTTTTTTTSTTTTATGHNRVAPAVTEMNQVRSGTGR